MSIKSIHEEDIIKYGKYASQNLPWSIQLCPTYGCQRAPRTCMRKNPDENGKCKGVCEFCGVWSLINKETDKINFKFMTLETAEIIAKQLAEYCPGRRIEINNFGEPLLNKNIFEIIKILRKYDSSVSIQLQTNGVGSHLNYEKFKEQVNNFFESGGNLLAYDAYDTYNEYKEFIKRYSEETNTFWCDFVHDNPNNYTYYRRADSSAREIYLVDDLGSTNKDKAQRHIWNHAGDVDPSVYRKYGICSPDQFPLEKKCSRVFREAIIGYDGCMSICCQSFRRRFVIGDIHKESFRDLWNSRQLQIIRQLMYNKRRDVLLPCSECDYNGGFRLGFLKNPELEITDEDLRYLQEVQEKNSHLIHYNGTAGVKNSLDANTLTIINSTMTKE